MRYETIYRSNSDYPAQLNKVAQVTSQFWSHLASHVPPPELYLLTDKLWEDSLYYTRAEKWGLSKKQGVYIYFAAEGGQVLYVGKANSTGLYPLKQCWIVEKRKPGIRPLRRWIYFLALSRPWAYLALSLEAYLISRLDPPFNKTDAHLPTPEGLSARIEALNSFLADSLIEAGALRQS